MKKIKVLVFPAWTEIWLEINRALRFCKDIELYWASSNISNHAPFVYGEYFGSIQNIHDGNGWIDDINELVKQHWIDCIFPAYDEVILKCAENINRFLCPVVMPSSEVGITTRFKSLTYKRLKGIIPVPEIFEGGLGTETDMSYPLFIKPDKGQGSEGAKRIDTPKQLRESIEAEPDKYLVCEYLPGEEYTVDCFSNKHAELLFSSGRRRIRTRNGISMSSEIVHREEFSDYAHKISKELGMIGAWFFQVKQDKMWALKLLEVAPRISGTMATSRALGVNFPLLSLYTTLGIEVSILPNAEYWVRIDRALTNRFSLPWLNYSVVYVDLDDTLVVNGGVNTLLIRFLYQAVNSGKKIVLITKSNELNLEEYLRNFKLNSLFDEIHHIEKNELKSDYITDTDSIFIDDSFSERSEVRNKTGIPVFDLDAVEALLSHTKL